MRGLLQRYVLVECLPTASLSLVVFTFVLLMQRLFRLSDLVIAKGVPLWEVMRLLGLALPSLLPLLLPVSVLLAVLLAMGRLSADSEIVAMRACGIGLADNVKPILLLSAVAAIVSLGVSLWAQPAASRSFREALYQSVKERLSIMTRAGVFTRLADGITVYAEGLDDQTGALTNLFLYLDRGPGRNAWVLARSGEIREAPGGLQMNLRVGEMHQRLGPGSPYRWLRFESYRVHIPLPAAVAESRQAEERPTAELLRTSFGPGADRSSRLELHRRLSLPVSCIVFGLLGASLGLHHSRTGRSRGVSVCLLVLFAYYALLTLGKALGERDTLPPEVAMWLPNGVLGAFSAYTYARKNREAPLPLEDALGRALRRVRAALHPWGG